MKSSRGALYLAPIVKEIQALKAKTVPSHKDLDRLDELNDKRECQVMDAIPRLTCCDASRSYHAVVFHVSDTPEQGRWYVTENDTLGRHRQSLTEGWHKVPRPEPKFCPFCGTPVPKMRLKSTPPKDLCRVTDGGYYCDTCKERLNGCLCLPPEAAFEVDS